MAHNKNAVRRTLDQARAAGRGALTAPEAKGLCEAYGIAVPKEAAFRKFIPPFGAAGNPVAYAYSTEIPVAVLGAKYRWARGAGLIAAV
jgi:Ligase-CoA domain